MKVLCSDEMDIRVRRTWTPLDFYVTGYYVAHSQCKCSLGSDGGSINDQKVELFSKGCHTSSSTTDSGSLSSVDFGANRITSEGTPVPVLKFF